jgi:hypothetical protein
MAERMVIFSERLGLAALCISALLSSIATDSPPLKIGSPLDCLKTTELHDSFSEIHNGHQ